MSPFGFSTTSEEVCATFANRIKGRTFLVTGTSTKGLGASCATQLARQSPEQIILVSRTKSKVEPVIEEIKAINASIRMTFVECELTDFDSVRKAAEQILSDKGISKIDAVINNAGVMDVKEYTTDKQGNELTFSANHLGHFLLTNLIMPKILAAGKGSRIVNVTSRGHRISSVRFSDPAFSNGKDYDGWSAYGQSKTANILFSVELARRLGERGIFAYSVHPGGIWDTGLTTHLENKDFEEIDAIALKNTGVSWPGVDKPKTMSQGSSSLLAAALDPAFESQNGHFVENCQLSEPLGYATDEGNAKDLWVLSEELVGQKFDV